MPLVSLQYLRCIAALMVVMLHIGTQLDRFGVPPVVPSSMARGVDIFFVLSGFLMWSTTAGRGQGPLEFYRRRIVRIVPLYWMLTSIVVAVMLVAPSLLQTVRFDSLNVIASYLFFFTGSASGAPDPVLANPVLVVGWTLNYEMLFYLIFGASLVLPTRLSFVTTTVVVVALVTAGGFVREPGPVAQAYTAPIMLEFVFGMAVAGWWRERRNVQGRAWPAATLLVFGFMVLVLGWESGLSRAVDAGIPATLILIGALWMERARAVPSWPALRWLGDISYSLYLAHPIALSAFAQAWRKLGMQALPAGTVLFVFAAVGFCVATAALTYYLLELPMTRRLGARTGARAAGPRAA